MLTTETDNRGVARVTLNRPEKHNAFDEALIAALHAAFAGFAETRPRAVILSGAGKSFCAGADADWMRRAAGWSEPENRADAQRLSDMLAAIDSCPAPVIAVATGAVMGGGVGLIACADLAVAHPDARFALSEVKLGITPATISPFVVRAIGARQARRWFLTAERFDAATAHAMGLVHAVSETPDAVADGWIAALLGNAPGAVADAKRLVLDIAGQPITPALRAGTAARIAARRTTDEAKEGMAAFLEKRAPAWSAGA
ncbi:MAG: enoyl-CoA hydratase-related protein [Sphingomonadaceae bacterium]